MNENKAQTTQNEKLKKKLNKKENKKKINKLAIKNHFKVCDLKHPIILFTFFAE